MKRIYETLLESHFKSNSQMLFLVGPRQVGKTTISKNYQKLVKESIYLNWDVIEDRIRLLKGQHFIEDIFPKNILRDEKPLVIFDEIHKYKNWKNYIKGFYDKYKEDYRIIVTGSARLDSYSRGGDSLMGRYFQLRVHPFSVSEILNLAAPQQIILSPKEIEEDTFQALYLFGGFPDPFLKRNKNFSTKWHTLRFKQLFQEDIRDLTSIEDIAQLEVLAHLLTEQVGQLLNRSSLAKKIQVTSQTVGRWMYTLEQFYFSFTVTPWSKNISRSLIKEPKIYLWDWSLIKEEGSRYENFIASHLLRSVHLWTDLGWGSYTLHYVRNKDKREVDFLIAENGVPLMLIEAKKGESQRLSSNLPFFQRQTLVPYSFQVIFNKDYIAKDCFEFKNQSMMVPSKTFLSQLA